MDMVLYGLDFLLIWFLHESLAVMDNKFGDRYVKHRMSRRSSFFSGLLVLLILCSTPSARDQGIPSKQLRVKCSSPVPVMWVTCLLNLTLIVPWGNKSVWHCSSLVFVFASLGWAGVLGWVGKRFYFLSFSLGDRQPHVVVLEEVWADTQVLMPERIAISSLYRVGPRGSLWQVAGIRHKFNVESSEPFFSQYEASLSWRAGRVFFECLNLGSVSGQVRFCMRDFSISFSLHFTVLFATSWLTYCVQGSRRWQSNQHPCRLHSDNIESTCSHPPL